MNGSRSMNDEQLSSAQARALILSKVVHSKEGWDRFVEELFYHKLRLLPWKN